MQKIWPRLKLWSKKDKQSDRQTNNNFLNFFLFKNIIFYQFSSMFVLYLWLSFRSWICSFKLSIVLCIPMILFSRALHSSWSLKNKSNSALIISVGIQHLSESFLLGLFLFLVTKSVIKTILNNPNYKTWNLPLFVVLLRFTFLFPVLCIVN